MSDRQFERAVLDWLADGSDRTPPRAIDGVLLAVRSTPQERELAIPRRFTTMTSSMRLLAAAIAVMAIIGGGAIWYVGQTNPPPTSTDSPIPTFAATPTALPSPSPVPAPSTEVVLGWPSTGENEPGLYSWDGRRCARNCIPGFMHNGYGSGDVAITIAELPDEPSDAGATAVSIAGRTGLYRRIVEAEPSFSLLNLSIYEEWFVQIDGIWVAISLHVRSGASDADLADAHAIIDSLRYERTDQPTRGFRLTFRLTNGEWDSG
jgi:hypothetical protein